MDFQALVDGMSAQWMKERAKTQMTLGSMIERLEALPGEILIGLGDPHRYRGYYSDLAFEAVTPEPAAKLLADCKEAMGKSFQGYKGGDFYMHGGVPVWVAFYGCCGDKLMAINDDGSLETAKDED
jgi:hypothetical protein